MNLESATPSQREGILSDQPEIVVVAGPGSGKTATTVARINRLIAGGLDSRKIVAISFTNAAARELDSRLVKIVKPGTVLAHPRGEAGSGRMQEATQLGFLGTLHSFALRTLKEHGEPWGYGNRTAIIAPDSAADLMASKASSIGTKTSVENLLKIKADKGRPPRGRRLTVDETIIATYLDELREAGVVDYDVLLHELHEMITSSDPRALSAQESLIGVYEHLIVDEVQDSARLHWAIIRSLPIPNKFQVGDPDQNLYEWNGARVGEMIAEASRPSVLVIKLEENFRSREEICVAAQTLIENNRTRLIKKTVSKPGTGGRVEYLGNFENEGEEIGAVARAIKNLEGDPSIAILSRTNDIADGFRRTLPTSGITVVETKRYQLPRDWGFARALIQALIDPENDSLMYFYVLANGINKGMTNALARKEAQRMRSEANAAGLSINRKFYKQEPVSLPTSALALLQASGVSREAHMIAVEKFRELPPGGTMEEFAISLANVTEYVKEQPGEGVHISSIHGAKGKEWDVVFLVGFEDEIIPGRAAKDGPEAIEAERRVAYVAITRARNSLYLSSVKSRVTPWKAIVSHKPSRFLKEIGL